MKSLICINTCNRLDLLRFYSESYYRFCLSNPEFDFIVSLDGNEQDYLNFFEERKIPYISSEERAGIGIAKNRVLDKLPDYDFYFFIEDDTEIKDLSYFDEQIRISQKTAIPHFSAFEKSRILDKKSEFELGEQKIIQSMQGSAQVNFFSGEGLRKVGGWHTEFAKYKRFGHTEHSYRFVNAGLMDYPFNVVESFITDCFDFHDPPTVTRSTKFELNPKTNLALVEEAIIDQKLSSFPIEVPGSYSFGNLDSWRDQPQPEPFLTVQERKAFLSERYFEEGSNKLFRRDKDGLGMLWKSIVYSPSGPDTGKKIKTLMRHLPLLFNR